MFERAYNDHLHTLLLMMSGRVANNELIQRNGSQLILTPTTHISSSLIIATRHWSLMHFINTLHAMMVLENLTDSSFARSIKIPLLPLHVPYFS